MDRLAKLVRAPFLLALLLLPGLRQGICAVEGRSIQPFRDTASLYLSSNSPYTQICLEVLAVEGCQPQESDIRQLSDYLTACTGKGVIVRYDELIPRASAAGMYRLLALRDMQGPPEGAAKDSTAYMLVLFYDGARIRQKLPLVHNPQVISGYNAVVYVDRSWFHNQAARKRLMPTVLKHEAGHLMGLCGRRNSIGPHCRNKNCIMYPSVPSDGVPPNELCPECRQELADARQRPVAENVRFVGPALVRQESGYFVVNLPSFCYIGPGDFDQEKWNQARRQLEKVKADLKPGEPVDSVVCGMAYQSNEVPEMQAALQAAAKDPDPAVRRMAKELAKKVASPTESASAAG